MINEEIRDKEVRLVDENGEQLGVMSTKAAMDIAEQKQLDLVKIAPTAKPPVCKIMDYGKFHFEQSKRDREARKNQKTVDIKEVRLSPTIEEHDMEVKAKNAIKFLKEGNNVKVSIRFRGRMISHSEIGAAVMGKFVTMIEDAGNVDRKPRLDGRSMVMTLTPKS